MIRSETALCKKLGVSDLGEVKGSKEAIAKLVQLGSQIDPALLARTLATVPECVDAFSRLIQSMTDLGKSLHDLQATRWEVLREIAKTGKLTDLQIVEAMQLIAEIEKSESIDWNKHLTTALKGLTVVLVAVFGILIAAMASRDSNDAYRDKRGSGPRSACGTKSAFKNRPREAPVGYCTTRRYANSPCRSRSSHSMSQSSWRCGFRLPRPKSGSSRCRATMTSPSSN